MKKSRLTEIRYVKRLNGLQTFLIFRFFVVLKDFVNLQNNNNINYDSHLFHLSPKLFILQLQMFPASHIRKPRIK